MILAYFMAKIATKDTLTPYFAIMPLYSFGSHTPKIDPSAWIAPSADIIGQVYVGSEASIWYQTALRGDINEIHIGSQSNIQDQVTIHLSNALPTIVGNRVTVGHKALLHACTIEDDCLIGMGAILMDGVKVGAQSIIGAGALLTGGTEIPPRSLVLGSPAKVVRPLSEEEVASLPNWAYAYTSKLEAYRTEVRPIREKE